MMTCVRDITFDLLRKLQLTTVVGNPGSTEQTFLKDFPADFKYIMALQEASVVGVADGLAQGLKKPVIVNLHTAAGLGNAMGCISTAYLNKTPLIITAGQQTRQMLLLEPFLANIEATSMPKPWVKWSYEPVRPEDVPASFMRAYAMAVQQPSGPVFLSLPMDDWEVDITDVDVYRTVANRVAPDPVRAVAFAELIKNSHNPLLIYGADIARSDAWLLGIELAEKLQAKVWSAPFTERNTFPGSHPLYAGVLPPAIALLQQQLIGHDLIIVIGSPIFRYYPFIPGQYLPKNTKLLHVTDDPSVASRAPVGDSLISDSGLFLESILPQINKRNVAPKNISRKFKAVTKDNTSQTLSGGEVLGIIAGLVPEEFILVEESPSTSVIIHQYFKINQPDSYYTFSSGGLGWNMPAAVGLALADKMRGRNRPVVAIIGDGSFQYSPQSIYTGVQENAHVIFIVLRNQEYSILKSFAIFENTINVPGLDLPGLDIVSLGKGYGAKAVLAKSEEEITHAFNAALQFKGTTVIEIPTIKNAEPIFG